MKYYPPRFLFRRYEILRRVKRGENFLEIGPGNLYLAVDLLGYFKRGTLVDFNPDIRERYDTLKKPLKERLDIVIANFSSSATQLQSKYDCIVACEVMEHIENDGDFLNKVYNLLNDHGQLVLSVPSRMHFWSKDDEIIGHFRRYEKRHIINILSKQGLRNIDIISYGFPFLNILRLPRILLARLQYSEKAHWSIERQTQQSGMMIQATLLINLLGIFCNPYTVYPLNLLASWFNKYDLSDGYVVTAEKMN
ncbi:MAG: class I SAM-dependent methyltransferase [Candidatus Hodarchaeota archaeon]